MPTSVPRNKCSVSCRRKPGYIFEHVWSDSRILETYGANCLLARRLAEKDVLDSFNCIYPRLDQHNVLADHFGEAEQRYDSTFSSFDQRFKPNVDCLEIRLLFGEENLDDQLLSGCLNGR